ncbi:MAG: S41 family peptidase [Chloroflexota bacterium]
MNGRRISELVIISVIWMVIGWVARGQYMAFQPATPAERVSRVATMLLERQFSFSDDSAEALADQLILKMIEHTQDPFATYIRPPMSTQYQENFQIETGSIGIIFKPISGEFVIEVTQDDGAAQNAGVQPNDVILAVDGLPVENLSPGEIGVLLSGPIGSSVDLAVLRENEELSFTIERQARESLYVEMIESDVGYLKLGGFSNGIVEPTLDGFRELVQSGAETIIWDLRGNTGGSMRATERVLGYFFEDDAPLYSIEMADGSRPINVAAVTQENAQTMIPLVVLVDSDTLSSSEMAAAVITESGRGTVIGQTTGGKGVIQDTIPIDQGYLMQFTVGKWITPNGEWLHETGLEPSVQASDNPDTEADEMLEFVLDRIESGN